MIGRSGLDSAAAVEDNFGSPQTVGQLFLTTYVGAFELVSLLLLVAAIAAVVLGAGPRPMRVDLDERQRRVQEARELAASRSARVTPGLGSYLIVSGLLFAIGLAGVLLRRSPLVVLLSLEVMLNSVNLSLVGFGRYNGSRDGQVFALVVMGVAAAEVVVGLGLIVAMERRKMTLDTDELVELRG